MDKNRFCRECGVPLLVSREFNWESNGVISLTKSPHNRTVLFEPNIIDNLFKGIQELIGFNIEHIVIESRRREVRRYIERNFPTWLVHPLVFLNERLGEVPGVRYPVRLLRDALGKTITRRVLDVGRTYGYGDVRPGPLWGSWDLHPWRINIMRNPYSVLWFAAECLASVEAFEGRDHRIEYREIAEGTYEYSAAPGEHPIELKEWLQRRRYDFKPGDVEYDRCPGCGIPEEVADLEWNLEEGTIYDPDSQRRMALFGPLPMDAIFHDLESELGESVSDVVVEAQRRYVKSRVGELNWRRSGATFNRLTAIRGMGNITEFEADEKHLQVTIQNACMPLLVIGMAQAIYEIAMNMDNTSYDWDMADDGDLSFIIKV
jgi:hypothetical protein